MAAGWAQASPAPRATRPGFHTLAACALPLPSHRPLLTTTGEPFVPTPHRPVRGFRHRPGLHEPEPCLRRAAAARGQRKAAAARAGPGRDDVRHRRAVRLWRERIAGRPCAQAASRQDHPGQQGRHGRRDVRRRHQACHRRPARGHPPPLRRQPQAAADGHHRPVLPAPLGQARAHRGQRRCDVAAGGAGQGARLGFVRSLRRDLEACACGGADRRRAVGIFAVEPQRRDRRAAGLQGNRRVARGLQPDRARVPHRHAARCVHAGCQGHPSWHAALLSGPLRAAT